VLARFFLLIILFIVIARNFWRFVDGVMSGAKGGTAPRGGKRNGPPVAVKMTQCPICGTYVVPGKAISLVSGGTAVFFDSEKCRAEYQSR
jgi:hypothetical protein